MPFEIASHVESLPPGQVTGFLPGQLIWLLDPGKDPLFVQPVNSPDSGSIRGDSVLY